MVTTAYKVTGMSCEHCVNAVTSELGNLSGVSDVKVDLVPNGVSLVTITSEADWPTTRSARRLTRPATTSSPARPGRAPGAVREDERSA